MAGDTKRIVLNDVLLPGQYAAGAPRSAFWGVPHAGETPDEQKAFHHHVAVLTVRTDEYNIATAVGIEYFHSEPLARGAVLLAGGLLMVGEASVLPHYGMSSNEGNRRVNLLVCCAIEGVEQGRERNLVTAMVRDTITAIKHDHGEVTDTAVREQIFAVLTPIFQQVYGVPLAVDEIRPRLPSKTGTPISAEVHSDDHMVEVTFDAIPWFEYVRAEDIVALANCGWGDDYPADMVATYMAEHSGNVRRLFQYLAVIADGPTSVGFKCRVDGEQAMAWLAANRREVHEAIE
jgi:hypothetical protein